MLGILGVLVGQGAFPSFNGEAGLDSEDLGCLCLRLGKLPQLGICGGQPERENSHVRCARWVHPQRLRGFLIAFEHVVGMTEEAKTGQRMKRIEADIRLESLDRFRRLPVKDQAESKTMVDEIMVQRYRSL